MLRGGSQAELNSGISREQGTIIKQAPGVAQGADGLPLASAEVVVIAELMKAGEKTGSNITVRGVEPAAFALRPQLKIVEGRTVQPGLRELIVGRGVAATVRGRRASAQTLRMRGSDWTVVGVFASGDANESELWADVDVAQSTFNRQGYSAVRLQLADAGGLQAVKDALSADPRLNVDVETEEQYFSGQTKQFRKTIGMLAGVRHAHHGARRDVRRAQHDVRGRRHARARDRDPARDRLSAACRSSFRSCSSRSCSRSPAACSARCSPTCCSTTWRFRRSARISRRSCSASRSRPRWSWTGLVIAVAIGMVGGFLPALRAARQPVTTALRAA